jgi:NAD(P)-dependent dehydrogenase (short-subunit alcohol dehydrogenase family)
MLVDIDAEGLQARTAELARRPRAIGHRRRLRRRGAVEGYAEAAMAAFGKIDGFFNNAGIEGTLAPTHEYPVERCSTRCCT